MSEQAKIRRPRCEYRRRANYKNLRWLRAKVSDDVHSFFAMQAYNKKGQKRGKGLILELLVKKFTTITDSILD